VKFLGFLSKLRIFRRIAILEAIQANTMECSFCGSWFHVGKPYDNQPEVLMNVRTKKLAVAGPCCTGTAKRLGFKAANPPMPLGDEQKPEAIQ